MSGNGEYLESIRTALHSFGIPADPDSIRAVNAGIVFRFQSPVAANQQLRNRSIFAQGPLGILHGGEVEGLETEYRSYRNGIGSSLHVVMGRGGLAYAELKRFNPYEGATGLVLHGMLELFPYLLKRLFRLAGSHPRSNLSA